jgi:hypothetical protein
MLDDLEEKEGVIENPSPLMFLEMTRDPGREVIDFRVGERTFAILPRVYDPSFFDASLFCLENILMEPEECVLEVGSGCGVFAVCAALSGSTVTAVDISPDAVQNTRMNAWTHNVPMRVYEGDVYDPLPAGERFDIVFWHAPYVLMRRPVKDVVERMLYDPHYEGLTRFIREGFGGTSPRVAAGGRMILGWSRDLGHMEAVDRLAAEVGAKVEILAERIVTAGVYSYCVLCLTRKSRTRRRVLE